MQSYISSVLQQLLSREKDISEYTIILPSKRAGSSLKKELSTMLLQPKFSPQIYSIEDFVTVVSDLSPLGNVEVLFQFYSVYKELTPVEKLEDFETFSNWAQTLIHDFNEIDRYLIDYESFFNYLAEIQDINHWYLQERTELIENYLSFWNQLPTYFLALRNQMLKSKKAYQGYIFRKASENIKSYINNVTNPHIFIGFNALNSAEQIIFQEFLDSKKGEVFWDVEKSFYEDSFHEAGYFFRDYFKNWNYYQQNPFNNFSHDFEKEKNIQIVGVPKNIGQAKYIGELLGKLAQSEVEKTAIVLGDEGLLLPLLNSLPPNITEVNITMGIPLKYAPISSLLDQIFNLHINYQEKFYYKDVLAIANHPLVQSLWKNGVRNIVETIYKQNLTYVSLKELKQLVNAETAEFIDLIFSDLKNNPKEALFSFKNLIFLIKDQTTTDKILLETLFGFHTLFSKLEQLIDQYSHVSSIKILFGLYKDLIGTTTLDIKGQPFKGLQIMGMLESRVLDFERVIIASVNEGVLPAGKSANSFIPFELKKAYNLPSYKEKDAVYTYHFYHLLQRSADIKLLYNTETDGLNAGEKSRFLIQLEVEKQKNHQLETITVSPQVPKIVSTLKQVEKTPDILEKLKSLAESGFSPSALTTYIRNPLDFYTQYILGIRDTDAVEETVAANTLGTAVHNTLEYFYKALAEEKALVTELFLKESIKNTPEIVAAQFKEIYTKAPLDKGKNLLIFEVAKRYVINFLKAELNEISLGNETKILQIEADLKKEIFIEGLDFPIFIRGKVDRIDAYNGKTRIIDYKTGKVLQNELEITDWELLTTDYDKYSKPFQVLTYASMVSGTVAEPMEAGVFSFKNMQAGFLKFSKKDENSKSKNFDINEETIEAYSSELKKLILEICNPSIPFIEKEIKQKNW